MEAKKIDLEKLRSINFGGRTRGQAKVTTLQEGGRKTGTQIEYGDGRVEAVVRPGTVRSRVSLKNG